MENTGYSFVRRIALETSETAELPVIGAAAATPEIRILRAPKPPPTVNIAKGQAVSAAPSRRAPQHRHSPDRKSVV